MIAGKLNTSITLLRPVTDPAAARFGGGGIVWEQAGTIHAQRVRASGHLSMEVGEGFLDYSVAYNVRAAHKVGEHWRLTERGFDDCLFEVVGIIPNRAKGYITLTCQRVNP